MAIFKQSLTSLSNLDRLLYLVNSTFFLALAKNTPWDNSWGTGINDSNPPNPNYNTSSIDNILLYKKPIYQTLAVDSQCYNIEFDSCGESISTRNKVTLINLETTSLDTLKLLDIKYVYIKVDITPTDINLLPINSDFRIAGLYKDITFNTTQQITYLPNAVVNSGFLYWVTYFTPIETTIFVDNKTSTFEILLKV